MAELSKCEIEVVETEQARAAETRERAEKEAALTEIERLKALLQNHEQYFLCYPGRNQIALQVLRRR